MLEKLGLAGMEWLGSGGEIFPWLLLLFFLHIHFASCSLSNYRFMCQLSYLSCVEYLVSSMFSVSSIIFLLQLPVFE